MGGSQLDFEDGARAARRIAADPAFSALDASGAPLLAAGGQPLRIVYLNDAARAVFGDDAEALADRLFRGAEPGARRLAELVDSVRHGGALRLERLRFLLDAAPQTVTVLCRKLSDDAGPASFVLAALGVRPAAPPQPSAPATPRVDALEAPADAELRARLAGRHGARLPRFLWKTDADGRFVDVTHVLGDIVGERQADILGRSVAEIVRDFALDPAFANAIASRKSWSGVTVAWPLDDAGGRVPATLGALPTSGPDRRFAGFQGYGVLYLDRAFVATGPAPTATDGRAKAAPPAASGRPVSDDARKREAPARADKSDKSEKTDAVDVTRDALRQDAPRHAPPQKPVDPPQPPPLIEYPDNIVRLRPQTARFAERDEPSGYDPALTVTERSAFDEIARALRAGGLIDARESLSPGDAAPEFSPETAPPSSSLPEASPEEPTPARTPSRDAAADASSAPQAPMSPEVVDDSAMRVMPAKPAPAISAATDATRAGDSAAPQALAGRDAALGAVLDRLPVGVLVARGEETLFVNRTLLDYLGYADAAAFQQAGGLARMFFGQAPSEGAQIVSVQACDGAALGVDAHMQLVNWLGASAVLVTLRRNRLRAGRGPEESALELARGLEEKLARARAENALLEAAFASEPEARAIMGADGRLERVNAAFAALVGVEGGKLAGAALAALMSPDDARLFGSRMRQGLGEDATLRLVLRGRVLPLEAELRRLDDDGRIAVSLRDCIAHSDSDLDTARRAAETASAAKSDFLARVSHEIRTPLNAILGFAEVMMEERFGPIGSERYKEYLKDVHASGSHVLSLVNDLLDLSKIEAGKLELAFERVDANAIISECASIMQTQANQARIVMRLALAPRLPPIRADVRSLKQILLNLLSNAVKFNEPGGQVIVSSALTEDGFVVIRVKDTGVGMSDDEVETALEPFKQIETARSPTTPRGTGLGLPVTKALIEANHASFTIKSRKNEGTLVEIVFPPPQVLAAE